MTFVELPWRLHVACLHKTMAIPQVFSIVPCV